MMQRIATTVMAYSIVSNAVMALVAKLESTPVSDRI